MKGVRAQSGGRGLNIVFILLIPVAATQHAVESEGSASQLASNNLVDLRSTIASTWKSSVDILTASPGSWNASEGCETPRLWVFLYGHYRAMWQTEKSIKAMAEVASNDCYLIVALMAQELDHSQKIRIQHSPRDWEASVRKTGRGGDMTASALLAASTLGDRLAYAVVGRTGPTTKVEEHQLSFWWHGLWAVAKWAARCNNFEIARSSVVMRTRPDLAFERGPEIGRLSDIFAEGVRGRHLILGQDNFGMQSDILMFTSFNCYENDIARPIEQGIREAGGPSGRRSQASWIWHTIGMTNGWGYGRSIVNRAKWPGWNELLKGCICLNSTANCSDEDLSCLATVVESPLTYPTSKLLRAASDGRLHTDTSSWSIFNPKTPLLNLTSNVHLYCPAVGDSPGKDFKLVRKGWWVMDRAQKIGGGSGCFRSDYSLALTPNGDAWPFSCWRTNYSEVPFPMGEIKQRGA